MTDMEREQSPPRSVDLYDQVQDSGTRERQAWLRRRIVWFRVLIPLGIVLMLVLGGAVYSTWRGITMNRYRSDVALHLMTVTADWPLQAEYQGQKTLVSIYNLERIHWALTLSQINLCLVEPETDATEEIRLRLPSGASYSVAPEAGDPDVAVIHYDYGSEKRTLSIRGYAMRDWLKRAISDTGITRPNTVVDKFPVVYSEDAAAGETGVETSAAENSLG